MIFIENVAEQYQNDALLFLGNIMEGKFTSIHSSPSAEVHDVPMNVLIRPFPPSVDEVKVRSLMKTLSHPETESQVPPVDVLWIKGRNGK